MSIERPNQSNVRRGWCANGAGLCIALLVVCAATRVAALDLRVQGRSSLSAEVRNAGTRIRVSGQLRDDLDQPLPHRDLQLHVLEEITRERVSSRVVETTREGTFSTTFDVAPGEYRVRLAFEATPHVVGTQLERTIRVRPEPVELTVEGPSVVRRSEQAVKLRVRARLGGTGVELPVVVGREGAGSLRRRLDATGRAQVDVSELLEPGPNVVRVEIPGDAYRERVVARHRLWLAQHVEVAASVESVFERFERGAAVSGRVSSREQPVPDVRVEAVLVRAAGGRSGGDASASSGASSEPKQEAERFTESGRTDEKGAFRFLFNRDELVDGTWEASVRVVPDQGPVVRRDVGTVEIDRTVSRFIVNGAAGVAILAIVLLVLREGWQSLKPRLEAWRRRSEVEQKRRRAFEQEATLEPVPVGDLHSPAGTTESGARDTVRGEVWDPWRDRPVSGARVRVMDRVTEAALDETSTGPEGRFAFEDLGSGQLELVIEADFFVRGRVSFELPHDGALNPCRFELIPVPLKIRRLYQTLIELAHGEDLWGNLPPSEIRDTVAGVLETVPGEATGEGSPFRRRVRAMAAGDTSELETSQEYLEALTSLVEETYFGPREYGEETWHLARRIALKLRERFERHVET